MKTDNLVVGQRVILKIRIMNEPVGSVGFVFSEYPDFDDPTKTGVQIVFQNGFYDGFSHKEQCEILEIGRVDSRYSTYKFENVNQVWRDYKNGYWKFQ